MTLNNKKSIILMLLVVVMVVFSYGKLLYGPQKIKIQNLQRDFQSKEKKIEKMQKDINLIEEINNEFKIMNSKVYEASKSYFSAIVQENLISILENMIGSSNIHVMSMTFSDKTIVSIEKNKKSIEKEDFEIKDIIDDFNNKEKKNHVINSIDSKRKSIKIEKSQINLNYKGNYEELISFIKLIHSYEKNIYIENMTVTKGKDNYLLGTLSLSIYAMPKINNNMDKLNFNINSKEYGKENIFSKYEEEFLDSSREKLDRSINLGTTKNDFVMTIKPISSDIPTVVLGSNNSLKGDSYVHGDKNALEDVYLEIKEDDEKYYYRYKTEWEKYPKNYDSMVEFQPLSKDINLVILTHKRNSEKDFSGVNFFIKNNSDKKLNIIIKNDDSQRSRVNIVESVGNIQVIR